MKKIRILLLAILFVVVGNINAQSIIESTVNQTENNKVEKECSSKTEKDKKSCDKGTAKKECCSKKDKKSCDKGTAKKGCCSKKKGDNKNCSKKKTKDTE